MPIPSAFSQSADLTSLFRARSSAYVPQTAGQSARTVPRVRHPFALIDPVQAPTPAAPDLDLVAAMARGEERAASELYDRHAATMFGLALRMVGESADAEEVVLDAFGQAWRDASRYDSSRASVIGWLTTIVRTRALDLIRARGRRSRMTDNAASRTDAPVAMGEGYPGTDQGVVSGERSRVIATALGTLPDPQRRAIELAFFEGLTHHEVAERLREPLGTVKTRIRLGMHKLRDMLRSVAPEGTR
jgi:RNA polymerase sigma-70 factor (ECF subfamily)